MSGKQYMYMNFSHQICQTNFNKIILWKSIMFKCDVSDVQIQIISNKGFIIIRPADNAKLICIHAVKFNSFYQL